MTTEIKTVTVRVIVTVPVIVIKTSWFWSYFKCSLTKLLIKYNFSNKTFQIDFNLKKSIVIVFFIQIKKIQ